MIKLIKKLCADTAGRVPIEQGLFVAVVCMSALVALEILGASFGLIFKMFFG